MKNQIKRPNDLAPRGVRYTIKSDYTFNDTFKHIFSEARKPLR